MASVLRFLHLSIAAETAKLRTAQFEGRDYLVVPVIALMEGVVWPGNSDAPEFVPAETLAKYPARWNSKPVVMTHPFNGSESLSAGDPQIQEQYKIGLIFNARMKKKQLHMDAWLDLAKIESLGGIAASTLQRVRDMKPVDVSIGAWTELEMVEGEYEGKKFVGRWLEIAPDHLAFLEEGVPGACSVEMGCGAPRVMQHRILSSGIEMIPPVMAEGGVVAEPKKEGMLARMLAAFKSERVAALVSAADMTDNNLRDAIAVALQATIPGFIGVVALKLAESVVVFDTWVNNNWQYKQQSYSLAEDGTVSLQGKPVDVEVVHEFKPMSADMPLTEDPPTTAAAPCGCKDKELITMKTKVERVKALIASKKTVFTDAHEAFLTNCSDAQIDQLEADEAAANEPEAVAAPAPAAVAAVPVPVVSPTVTQARAALTIDDLPAELKALVNGAKAQDTKVRDQAMATLKASKQTQFSDTELATLTTDQLVRVAALVAPKGKGPSGLVDYSAQNTQGVVAVIGDGNERVAPPSTLAAAIAEKRSTMVGARK